MTAKERAKGRARVAAAIARARANGEKLPSRPRRPLRIHHPFALEAEYYRVLRIGVADLYQVIRQQVEADYPVMVAQVSGSTHSDALSSDLDRWLRAARAAWQVKQRALAHHAKQIAARLSRWNLKVHDQQIKHILGVDVFTSEPWLEGQMDLFSHENAQLIKSLGDTAIDRISFQVTEAVRKGTSTRDLARAIASEHGIAERRAALIAVDQIGKFNGKLTQLRQSDLGIGHYRWRGVLDRRERASHVAREGVKYSWDNPPADGNPGEPVRCRCIAEPVLDDFDDLLNPSGG